MHCLVECLKPVQLVVDGEQAEGSNIPCIGCEHVLEIVTDLAPLLGIRTVKSVLNEIHKQRTADSAATIHIHGQGGNPTLHSK